jgi:hypothetical protein
LGFKESKVVYKTVFTKRKRGFTISGAVFPVERADVRVRVAVVMGKRATPFPCRCPGTNAESSIVELVVGESSD